MAILAADPSRLASLLVVTIPMGMPPPRASPSGRLSPQNHHSYLGAVPTRCGRGAGANRAPTDWRGTYFFSSSILPAAGLLPPKNAFRALLFSAGST